LLLLYAGGVLFGCLEGDVSSFFFLIEAGYGCLTSFLLSCVCVVVILFCLSAVCRSYHLALFGGGLLEALCRGCCFVEVFCGARWCGSVSSSFCYVPSVEWDGSTFGIPVILIVFNFRTWYYLFAWFFGRYGHVVSRKYRSFVPYQLVVSWLQYTSLTL
jgi:hypothetical protein